jgi:hypothetical protein
MSKGSYEGILSNGELGDLNATADSVADKFADLPVETVVVPNLSAAYNGLA